jgi:glycerol kinase
MSYVLAIDQSTSASKATLFDAAGGIVDSAAREHRQIYPRAAWVEHDAEEIWQNVLHVVGEIAKRNRQLLFATVGLAITNQRETFVIFDRASGRPLYHAIVWQCRRGDPVCAQLIAEGQEEAIRAKTGLKLDTYFTGSKLSWLIRAEPEIRRQLERGDALVGTIDTYLIYRLTRGAVFATDPTNASRTLLYDIARLRWDDELCTVFGVPMHALAEVRESFAPFGTTDANGALPQELPVCGVLGDSQASLFAQCCFAPGMAKATFGSGTSVMLNTGQRLEVPDRGTVAALAWIWRQQPTYALEGIINYSSATIAWLKDQLGLIADATETSVLAQSVEDNAGVYLVPAFSGLSAPYWSATARAAIVGMTAYTRKEHIVRAGLEAIAYQIRDVLDMVREESGIAPEVLHADGGPTRNELLMQFTADITGLPIHVAEVADSSARGAAMAAMLGLGVVGTLEELAALPRQLRTYRPQMDADRAAGFYRGWQAAVQRVL